MHLVAVRGETNGLGAGLVESQQDENRFVDFSAVEDAATGKTDSYANHG